MSLFQIHRVAKAADNMWAGINDRSTPLVNSVDPQVKEIGECIILAPYLGRGRFTQQLPAIQRIMSAVP
jgi:hypothetical protein